MVFFEWKYQALFFTAVECFGNNAYVAAYFFAMHQFQRRIGQFSENQRFDLLGRIGDLVNKIPECVVQTGLTTFFWLSRNVKTALTM